jgi:ABC-type nitrate/sulfonate/bicarbonate transport system substrate-binding protein
VQSGLFERHGLDVELMDPPPPPGMSNSARVAAGGADFCLTGVAYHLFAVRDAGGGLAARFVSVLHQRSALAALVPESCDIRSMADLSGRRVGASATTGWLATELAAVMADRGLAPPVIVPVPDTAPAALAAGLTEMVATGVDVAPGVADKVGAPVRAIHVGHDLYASGLVAGDHVPAGIVQRAAAAVAAAFEAQRADPEQGMAEFCRRFDVDPERAAQGWALLQPFAFGDAPVGSMRSDRWADTLAWLCRVHGLPTAPVDTVVRTELCLAEVGS